jgi:hypothetical protein
MLEKNSIDLDDPLAIAGTRVLDAPRDLVWKVADYVSKMAARTS